MSATTAAPSGGSGLAVGATGFAGHGRLAFVSGNRLYVLDGTAPGKPATLHAVRTGKVAGDLAWSPDGKWLAFLVGGANAYGSVLGGQLWLAGPDGQDAHPVLANSGPFAWSPKADVLAVLSGGSLDTLTAGQAARPVFTTAGLTGTPAWSPDGATIAVSVVHFTANKAAFAGSDIELVTPGDNGGVSSRTLAQSAGAALLVDGWQTDGQGLFAWADPLDSASLAADGVPLVSYPLNGKAVTLPSTLAHPSFAVPWVGGVIVVTGGDRRLWSDKTFEFCFPTGGCGGVVNAPPGPVNLDPAWGWSVYGQPIVTWVHAAPETAVGPGQAGLSAWYKTRQLWVWTGLGGNSFQVTGAGTGIAAPVWSANGKYILYVRDNALWLIDPYGGHGDGTPSHPAITGGPAVRVVSQLFAGPWPDYYGYTNWQSQFAWYSAVS